jgi:hypothetical protein
LLFSGLRAKIGPVISVTKKSLGLKQETRERIGASVRKALGEIAGLQPEKREADNVDAFLNLGPLEKELENILQEFTLEDLLGMADALESRGINDLEELLVLFGTVSLLDKRYRKKSLKVLKNCVPN